MKNSSLKRIDYKKSLAFAGFFLYNELEITNKSWTDRTRRTFPWKMKISFPENCTMEEACIVEMSDNTTCRLSARKWNEVLQTGLEACGYLNGREIVSVVQSF